MRGPHCIFDCLKGLLQVLPHAPLSQHLEQEVLDDHQQEQHLALLTARHPRQHVQEVRIDLSRQGDTVLRGVRHALAPAGSSDALPELPTGGLADGRLLLRLQLRGVTLLLSRHHNRLHALQEEEQPPLPVSG